MTSKLLIFTLVALSVLLVSQVTTSANADVVSPKKQIKIGLDQSEIICKADLVKVYRINADSFDCFTPSTAEKLVKKGIAKDVPKDKLEAKKTFRQNAPIGSVTTIDTVKKFGSEGRLTNDPRTVEYLYVFELCAFDKTIRAPEILVKSDSEAKTVKLAKKVTANSCITSTTGIKAANPTSISASLTNKGLVTDTVTNLETKITDLQKKLSDLKKNFSGKVSSESLDDDSKMMISNTSDEIVKLRLELNQAKGELNKYLFTLHSPQLPASQFVKPKLTFSGEPLAGVSTNILTVSQQATGKTDTPSTGGLKLYNVVFDACSGNDVLRAPEVRVTSDSEEKIIKIAERIIANSCQMSAAKINAVDKTSVVVEIVNREGVSAKIVELEARITNLLAEQSTHETALNKLVVQSVKPADYEQKVSELSSKIIKLRADIRDAKYQLYGNLYAIYSNP